MASMSWLKDLYIRLVKRVADKRIHIPLSPSLQETMNTSFQFSPDFTQEELACKCCGKWGMNDNFMKKIISLRWRCGFAFPVTSPYRCKKEEKRVGGKGNNHPLGRALDISLDRAKQWKVIELAPIYGFTGIGIKAHGLTEERYIHLDDTHSILTYWTYE